MRLHLRIRGRVQGVGYRFFARASANALGLTGWVRNCSNGEVECEAQGEEKKLQLFLEKLERAHSWARVDAIRREEIADQAAEDVFEIID